jgi:phosphoribosylanthranilate isomerase
MAKVKVKICGITNWKDARLACAEGADFLGFNFYRRSPRYISPAKAQRIIARMPKGVAAVGVFVNEKEEKTLAIAERAGLDYVQLHGEEPTAAIGRLRRKVRVIRVARVRNGFRPAELGRLRRAAAILLDGFDPTRRGGTGKTFDWSVARRSKRYARIFLAGGLNPENVAEAIRTVGPYAVDVCSGVEARPGKKDARKLKRLMSEVRAAEKWTR